MFGIFSYLLVRLTPEVGMCRKMLWTRLHLTILTATWVLPDSF
jgi:hypothetical protein